MNKSELVMAIAEKTGLSKKDADSALAAVVSTIKDTVIAGEKVQIVGFGTFETRTREARMGRDPRTNQQIQISASKSPAFKAGKVFKDEMNA